MRAESFEVVIGTAVITSFFEACHCGGNCFGIYKLGDLILKGDTEKIAWYKIALTYLVPYCVSTYSAIVNGVSKE